MIANGTPESKQTVQATHDILATVTQNFKGAVVKSLPSASEFVKVFAERKSRKLQHDIVRPTMVAKADRFLASRVSDADRAHFLAVRAPKADALLRCPIAIENDVMATYLRLRFKFDPCNDMPDVCPLCDSVDMQVQPWHWLDCRELAAARIHRHNAAEDEIAIWVSNIGGHTQKEPMRLGVDEKDRRRPDTRSIIGTKQVATDECIVDPICPSNVRLASQRSLAVAASVEKKKQEKYAEMLRLRRTQFFPVVLETTGGMGKECAKAISEMIIAGKSTSRWAPHEVVFGLRWRLPILVARWNARFVQEALWRAECR
jgi:hypothetical protein